LRAYYTVLQLGFKPHFHSDCLSQLRQDEGTVAFTAMAGIVCMKTLADRGGLVGVPGGLGAEVGGTTIDIPTIF